MTRSRGGKLNFEDLFQNTSCPTSETVVAAISNFALIQG